MIYQMRQKLFAFGDDYAIKDEQGREVFYVDGRALSFGDKLDVKDSSGREVAFIRQKLLSWGPTYEIYRDDHLAAVVKKELFTFFRCRFSVDVPGPDDLEAEGDFWEMEYTFRRGGAVVAEVSKRWFTFADTYGIQVAPGEDHVMIVASAVVIDLCCHGDKQHR
jgi:uncharacterized protein YxjI